MSELNKEVRSMALEGLSTEEKDNDMILEGYAAVFDKPTVLWTDEDGTEYKEVIDRHAFDKTDMKKCCLKYNHESNVPVLARVRGGSLELNVDDYGLHFRAKLFNTQTGRDIYELVKAGGIDECSFAFSINGDAYDRQTHTRTLTDIGVLWDCSVVDHPAYTEGTSVAARSFLKAEAEKEALEKAEEEQRAKELELAKAKLRLKAKVGI